MLNGTNQSWGEAVNFQTKLFKKYHTDKWLLNYLLKYVDI